MNKKGQVVFFGLMLGLTIIILVLAISFSVKQGIDNARNESTGDTIGMNCSTTNDNFVKAACVVTDYSMFYFIGGLLFIAGGALGAKIIFG